jgi:hypothetical protein|nr:MAG TPA: hypothetical protein [Caudoviricetes sp.]
MKQERQFNGRFTEEAANCIMQLINNGHIKGMRNADGYLPAHMFKDRGDRFESYPITVGDRKYTEYLTSVYSGESTHDIIGFGSKLDYDVFKQVFYEGKTPHNISFPVFAIDASNCDVVLFTNYTIGYAVTPKALNKVHDVDIRENDRFLVIDFELAEQFLIPRKRRNGNRFTLAAANLIKNMIMAGEITKLQKADGEIIDCKDTRYEPCHHQSFSVGGYYYETDLSNVGKEANINDIVDIPIRKERKLFKERFNSLYRTGLPCFYISKTSDKIVLASKTHAIEMKEGAVPVSLPLDDTGMYRKVTFKEASIQLGECNVIDDVYFGNESAANIISLMIRLKLCKGNLMFGSEEYLGQLYYKNINGEYFLSIPDEDIMYEVKIVNGKLRCNEEEFSNFASLVDFKLFTKLYSMRYMKG